MSQWDENWKDYTDTLFVVDENQKILGTFFSKGDFSFNVDNKITGSDIMWIPTDNDNDNDDYNYDIKNDQFSLNKNLQLFHKKLNSEDEGKIYSVTFLNFDNSSNTVIQLKEKKITQISNNSIEPSTTMDATQVLTSNKTSGLLKSVENLNNSIKNHISENFNQNKQSVGGRNENIIGVNDDDEFIIIDDLVKNFEELVYLYITHPTILKLNSLSSNEINNLFKNNSEISIEESIYIYSVNSVDIKRTIFDFLFYKFNYNVVDNNLDNDDNTDNDKPNKKKK